MEAPVDLLPTEILDHIFFSYCSDYLLPLGHVSSRWRSLCLARPEYKPFLRPFIDFLYSQGNLSLLFWTICWAIRPGEKKNIDQAKELFVLLAARLGRIEVLQWSLDNGFTLTAPSLFDQALLRGQLETLEWLSGKGFHSDFSSCQDYWAVLSGKLEVVKWVEEKMKPSGQFDPSRIIRLAVEQGHLHILQHYYCPHSEGTELFNLGIRSGNLEVLKFLRQVKSPWGSSAWKVAGVTNNLEILDFLFTQGCPRPGTNKALLETAKAGRIEATEWFLDRAHYHDNFYSFNLTVEAAMSGNLELVQRLVTRGHQLNSDTLREACFSGNLQLAQWVKSQGVPWPDRNFTFYMAQEGYESIFQWMIKETDFPIDWPSLFTRLIIEKKLGLLQKYEEYFQPSADLLNCALEHGNLQTLKWLIAKGCPYDKEYCLRILPSSRKAMRKWLEEH